MDAVFKTDKAVFNFRVAGIWVVNNHVLLHKDVKDAHWSLPGGRVAIGEETMRSIEREFLEELGVNVSVDRLLWTNENFFNYRDEDFHEIAFYYKVSADEAPTSFKTEPFYGLEGERLIYKWTPIEEINDMNIVPEFIKRGIKELPEYPQHIVVKEKNAQ